MALQKNLQFVITGRDESATSTMSHIGSVANKLSSTFLSLGGVIAGAFAVERIVEFGKRSVEAFAEEQTAQESLAFSFQKFPALMDSTIDQFDKLNEKIQSKTGIDHSQLASAEAVLASFGLTGAQLKKLTPLVADYAAKTGQDASTAATSLGRALLGNTRALKAIGVDFKNTHTLAGNYDELVQALTEHVGGFAEAQGQTFAGQLNILKLSFQDVTEKLGGVFAPALTDLVGIMTDHVIPAFDDLVTIVGPKVKVFLDTTAKGLASFIDAIAGSVKSNSLKPLEDFFDNAAKKFPAIAVMKTVGDAIAPILPQLSQGLLSIGDALMQKGVIEAIDKLITAVLPPLVDLLVAITPLIPPLADALTKYVIPAFQDAVGPVEDLLNLFSSDKKQSLTEWAASIVAAGGSIGTFAAGAVNAIAGFVNPMVAALNGLADAFTAFYNRLSKAFGGGTISLPHLPGVPVISVDIAKGTGSRKRAQGGTAMHDEYTWVGENGPELVKLNARDHVFPAGARPTGGGGAGFHLHLEGPVYGSPNAYAQSIVTLITNAVRQGHVQADALSTALTA